MSIQGPIATTHDDLEHHHVEELDTPTPPGETGPLDLPPKGTPHRLVVGLRNAFPPLVVSLLALGAWYFVTYVLLDESRRFLMPAPHEVLAVGFLEWENLVEMLEALWLSAQVAFVGLAVAIVLGMALAVAMSQARWIERSLFPYAVALQAVPILALVPLLGFWFGFSFTSRVIVCVIIALFPIVTNTLFGLLSAERGQHDLMTLHGASRLTRLRKLQFPAALPAIFTGFRISAGLAVIGAIVGDFFFRQGQPGIGQLIDRYRARLLSEELFAAIILSSLLGIVVFWFFGWLQQRVIGHWHEQARDH
ncbi:MAG TPA: ABC transporter permease [Acidimicrobiales bacterium]|nr:ABC transporter permease [Acidimicrobiales bacterium]